MTFVPTATPQQVSGKLNLKRIAAFMQQQHKRYPIRVERCAEDELAFYLGDTTTTSFKVPQRSELYPYAFGWQPRGWQRATFPVKNNDPEEGGPDQPRFWRQWGPQAPALANHVLTLTDDLKEEPGARGKPGTLYRKLTFEEGFVPVAPMTPTVYIAKRILDAFSPDLDELGGFLFETSGKHRPVRVSASGGIVGYVMPAVDKGAFR